MYNKNKSSEFYDQLYEAIACLKTPEEAKLFIRGLCSYQEISSFAQRLQVAKMLVENYVYSDIVDATGTSTATISRVNRSLHDENSGYEIVFKRLGIIDNTENNKSIIKEDSTKKENHNISND